MKKKFLYNALIILALTACTEQDIIDSRPPRTGDGKSGFPPMSTRVNC